MIRTVHNYANIVVLHVSYYQNLTTTVFTHLELTFKFSITLVL